MPPLTPEERERDIVAGRALAAPFDPSRSVAAVETAPCPSCTRPMVLGPDGGRCRSCGFVLVPVR